MSANNHHSYRYRQVQPGVDFVSMTLAGPRTPRKRRRRCAMCGKQQRNGADKSKCPECKRGLAQFQATMAALGPQPRCPKKMRRSRIELYAQRAHDQVDLFEQPLSNSILD